MSFKDENHQKKIAEITKLWGYINELGKFAKLYNIDDIFQDNEGKVLQQLVYMNFSNLDGREGNDGLDENGVEWEMKSVNIEKTTSVSTHHHLNLKILSKYRLVPWSFAAYKGTDLQYIYAISPIELEEEYFTPWENRITTDNKELNNPKINLDYIIKHGTKIFSKEEGILCNPTSVYDEDLMLKNIEYDFSTSTKIDIEDIITQIEDYIKSIHEDIEIKVINNKTNKPETEYLIKNKPFLRIKKNKESAIIFLAGINHSENEFVSEIKRGKKKYSSYMSKYEQKNRKESLNTIKDLIKISFQSCNR